MRDIQDIYLTNLNVVCNLGGFLKTKPDTKWKYGLHRFSQNKFYFITKGRCIIRIENQEYIAKGGDWFYIPANTLHGYSTIDGETFEKYWAHFDIYPNNEIFHSLNLPPMINVSENKAVLRLFKKFLSSYNSSSLCDKIEEKSSLMALLGEYIRIALPEDIMVKSVDDKRINEIIRFINSNLNESISLSELAKRFYLHPNHFIRFFKNKTGVTPVHYIKMRKMETAKRLLEDSDLSVTEIIEKIGENNLNNFSKQFKNYYGLSPRKYREFFLTTKII